MLLRKICLLRRCYCWCTSSCISTYVFNMVLIITFRIIGKFLLHLYCHLFNKVNSVLIALKKLSIVITLVFCILTNKCNLTTTAHGDTFLLQGIAARRMNLSVKLHSTIIDLLSGNRNWIVVWLTSRYKKIWLFFLKEILLILLLFDIVIKCYTVLLTIAYKFCCVIFKFDYWWVC